MIQEKTPTYAKASVGKKEKVARKQGLNPDFIIGMSSQPTRGYKPQTMKGIIGKKIGMTSIFAADGKQTACTIIEAAPNTVTQVKTVESDGYTAFN
jgi:hypothetical protein